MTFSFRGTVAALKAIVAAWVAADAESFRKFFLKRAMKMDKKKTKGEKDWVGRMLLILDTLWEILAGK